MGVNPYQQYQQNSVLTASPMDLTLMLYNGAIKFCNQAIEALENKEIEKSHHFIIKAQAIIGELQATLDKKQPISNEIDPLYTFIQSQLIEGNMTKNKENIQTAKEFIVEFRDLWKQVIEKNKLAGKA